MIWQAEDPPLVLASQSVARRDLLQRAGLRFDVVAPGVDEAEVKASARADGASTAETALLLADLKARAVERRRPGALVIGGDQLLVLGDRWFDKPRGVEEAKEQLRALRGQTHTLATAVCCRRNGTMIWHHVATPRITMRVFSDRFLDDYIASVGDSVIESVGCYKVESVGVQLFERVEGDETAVRGLPLLPLIGFLRQHGVLMD